MTQQPSAEIPMKSVRLAGLKRAFDGAGFSCHLQWRAMSAVCAGSQHRRSLHFYARKRSGDYNPSANANAIQIMTVKVSKGLELPVVALPGVGHMPAAGEDEQEAARVFYVATTRATQRLVIGVAGLDENSTIDVRINQI